MSLLTKPLLIRIPLVAIAMLVTAGCRNTTTSPVTPLGTSSPLSPVQGSASLSPLLPTGGVSSFGAPTRVPPPPTGSYKSPNVYGTTPPPGTPAANYAPTGISPSGATLGSTGMARGVTDLSSSFGPPPAPVATQNSSVMQTGWVGDAPVGTTTYGSGFESTNVPAAPPMPTAAPPVQPRSGGMKVIDLTASPYPPGYTPPQNRTAAVPFPQSTPYPQAPSNVVPMGQSSNSTFVQSPTPAQSTNPNGFVASPSMQTAGRPDNSMLPSTEPFSSSGNAEDELQWRRPSPKF